VIKNIIFGVSLFFAFGFSRAEIVKQTLLPNKQALYKAYVTGKKEETGKVFYNLKGSSLFFLLPEGDKASIYQKRLDRSLVSQEELRVIVDMKKMAIDSVQEINLKSN
jgi:hypothetical protein